MTQQLIDIARRRPSIWVRPVAAFVLAVVLGYGGVLWMNVLHQAQGAREVNEPPLLVHWLRDGTLALPLVFFAVWAGLLVCRRLVDRLPGEPGPVAGTALVAVLTATSVSVVLGLSNPLHGVAFGHTHAHAELPWALHMGRDALAAFAAEFLLASVAAAAMVRHRPWSAPAGERWAMPSTRRARTALKAAVATLLLAPAGVFAVSAAEFAVAGAGRGQPCPSGAPTRVYDVRAIDVDIPLNRFGDHDPQGNMYVAVLHDAGDPGKLDRRVQPVRAEEASRHVTNGLRNDPIQPMVVRANMGECVEVNYTNDASGGDYGFHVDGLSFEVGSSGDAFGNNAPPNDAAVQSVAYRYFVPNAPEVEGLHYVRPGPGFRDQVSHGLFGAIGAEPPGSRYLHLENGRPLESGWEATIVPGNGKKAFREYAQLYHEIGNEDFDIPDGHGGKLPRVDPHTDSYRPGARGMNYRSEPFFNRLERAPKDDSLGYSSYPFGDPATIIPRGYQGDPTKIRILHAGSEMFHVFHLHGGGIRWRYNPVADHTFDYQDTGLNKKTKTPLSPPPPLFSPALCPTPPHNPEIEGGAGGVQQGAGEFLFHCHIAEHYISGMWGFWRVYDTVQPDLSVLPDRADALPPTAVTSQGLIGNTYNGTKITAQNIDDWVRPQLPPQGGRRNDQDAAVWNWKVDDASADGPLYLGEPEDRSDWADFKTTADDNDPNNPGQTLPGHPSLFPTDVVPPGPDQRPAILFDPENGRPAFPLLRPHLGQRNPFSPNGHSGAPGLGENGNTPVVPGKLDPYAGRPDGICPAGATPRKFNVVAIQTRVPVTTTTADPNG